MARPKDPDLEHAWRQRLRRQTSSGLSIPAFCAREGSPPPHSTPGSDGSPLRSLPARPRAAPVRSSSPRSLSTQADPVPGRGVEIELPHRVRLRFDAPPEPEWLVRVVAALAGLPSQEATS